jgi:predicted N-acetyltransferase YhbS
VTIDYLANHRDSIPQLANWGYREWRPVFDQLNMTLDDVIASFQQRTETDKLPLGLVAIIDDVVVGTGALKEHDLQLRPNLSPWLGGMFVDPKFRNGGVGSVLVTRLIEEARKLKLPRLYLWTTSAESLYLRLGWTRIEKLQYCGYDISLMDRIL